MNEADKFFSYSFDLEPLEVKTLEIFAARLAKRQVKADPE